MNTERYFSPDYATARRRFHEAAARAGARVDRLEWGLRGPAGEPLGIDIAVLGYRRARRVLLHSTGIHGVEGFAGSAIQLRLLENPPPIPADGALVLVHVINPYGMAYLRRVNESNVDLNRNFLGKDEAYAGMPDGYEILHPLFNPPGPAAGGSPGRLFGPRLLFKLMRHGFRRLRQAGAGGQYEYPRGLFFGGRGLERGPRLYLDWLSANLTAARRVCAIDVHTGLGRRGEQLIILERNQGGAYHRYLEPLYAAQLDNTGLEPAIVYQVRGGVDAGVPRVLEPYAREIDFVTQEFGTVHGFRVLEALSAENCQAQYGNANDLLHPAKLALKHAFNPPATRWKHSVLQKGEELAHHTAVFLFSQG